MPTIHLNPTKIGITSIVLLSILLVGGALASSGAYSTTSAPTSTQSSTSTFPTAPATWSGTSGKFLSGPQTVTPSFGAPPSASPSASASTSHFSGATPNVSAKPLAPKNKQKDVPAVVSCGTSCESVSSSGGVKTNPYGLNAFEETTTFSALAATPNYTIEPPDQGICANSQFVVEALNIGEIQVYSASTLQPVSNGYTTFDSLMALAKQGTSGWSSGGDIMCNYDYGNGGHWIFTEFVSASPEKPLVAGGQPGPFQGCFVGIKDSCYEGIAVSVTNNPLGKYYVYFYNPNKINNDPGVGYFLNDYVKTATTRDAFMMFYDEFNQNGTTIPACPAFGCGGFNGAQQVAFNKNALENGWSASKVTAAYENMGNAKNLYPIPANGAFQPAPASCFSGVYAGFVCWYQVIPAQSADPSQYDNSNGGTGYMFASLDFLGAGDNRAAVFAWSDLSALNSAGCSSCSSITFGGKLLTTPVVYRDEGVDCLVQYGGVCGLGKQKAGPIPLGDNCGPLIPTSTASCPEGGIATNGDGATQASYGNGHVWGAIATGLVQKFASSTEVHLGAAFWEIAASGGSASLTSGGYVSPAHADVEFASMAAMDSGGALISFTLSGKAFYPSSAYDTISSSGTVGSFITITALGKSPTDGFTEYQGYPGTTRPRWGDYGGAIYVPTLGVVFASEYIEHPNCSSNAFLSSGGSCGGTRALNGNWGSSINILPSPV
jgi:hypothetical protein